jgi:hypothetical protein
MERLLTMPDILINAEEIETNPFKAYLGAILSLFEQTHKHLSPSASLNFDLSIKDKNGNHTLLTSTLNKDFVTSEVN